MEALVIIGLIILVDIAAWRWGVHSIEAVDSPEWERRRAWRGFARSGR